MSFAKNPQKKDDNIKKKRVNEKNLLKRKMKKCKEPNYKIFLTYMLMPIEDQKKG